MCVCVCEKNRKKKEKREKRKRKRVRKKKREESGGVEGAGGIRSQYTEVKVFEDTTGIQRHTRVLDAHKNEKEA